LNDADGTVDAAQFYDYVADASGADDADLTRGYAETTDRPTVWNVSTHQAVFGSVPARIESEIATEDGQDAVRAGGPYRNRTLRTPYVLVPGERLSVDVSVENSGGTAGDYDVRLRDGETTLDRRIGGSRPATRPPSPSTTPSTRPGTTNSGSAANRSL